MDTEEIKQDIISRGWTFVTIARIGAFSGWDCTIHDLTIETEEDLYLAPIVTRYGDTEEEAITNAYMRALEYLPGLPARYDEHGITYKRCD